MSLKTEMDSMHCSHTEVPNIEKNIHVMLKCDEDSFVLFNSERMDFYFRWWWTIHRV